MTEPNNLISFAHESSAPVPRRVPKSEKGLQMAKSKSKKSGKAREAKPSVAGGRSRKNVVPRGVRKHLKELERQLSDAARQERKRLRKLDRATFRRLMLQAALEELRGETMVVVMPIAEMTPAQESPVVIAEAAVPVVKAVARPATKPRSATVRTPAARATTTAAKAAPRKAAPKPPARAAATPKTTD